MATALLTIAALALANAGRLAWFRAALDHVSERITRKPRCAFVR